MSIMILKKLKLNSVPKTDHSVLIKNRPWLSFQLIYFGSKKEHPAVARDGRARYTLLTAGHFGCGVTFLSHHTLHCRLVQ